MESLLAEVRLLSPVRVATVKTAQGYIVTWEHREEAPRSLTLLTGYPIEVEAKSNLAGIKPSSTLGMTSLTFEPKEPGLCSVLLKLPEWARDLPESVPVPVYEE